MQVHAAAATSLPAVLDGPGDVGELVPEVSGSVEGMMTLSINLQL